MIGLFTLRPKIVDLGLTVFVPPSRLGFFFQILGARDPSTLFIQNKCQRWHLRFVISVLVKVLLDEYSCTSPNRTMLNNCDK